MEKKILFLLITSTLLVGCGQKREIPNKDKENEIVYVDKATIKLNDGSEKELDSNPLTEDEYRLISEKLNIPEEDFDYKFTNSFFGDTTIEGTHGNHEAKNNSDFDQFYYFSVKSGKDEMYIAYRSKTGDYLHSDLVDYATSYNKLQYGSANIATERYYNDDIPLTLPAEMDTRESFVFNKEVYFSFNDLKNMLSHEMLKFYLSFDGVTYNSSTYGTMKDPIIHTHKLSTKYLIIEESCKGCQIDLKHIPSEQTKDSYWQTLINGNYSVKKQYFYNLNTANLDRVEFIYDTIDPLLRINTNLKFNLTATFNINNYDNNIKNIDKAFNDFLAFDGVSKH